MDYADEVVSLGGTVPMFVESTGPDPDFVTCLLYLDCGNDLARLRPLLTYWYDETYRTLMPYLRPAGAPEPVMSLSVYDHTADGRPRRRKPHTWDEGVTPDLHQLSVHWSDTVATSLASELDLYVFRFADNQHVRLQISVGFQNRPGGLKRVLPDLVDLMRRVADVTDPTYGEIVVNAETMAPATMLDGALSRSSAESARDSRRQLRGYEWVTICPSELATRLGGAEVLRATGAFDEVVPLAHGGLLLQATADPDAYRDGRLHAVHRALAPVLPAGQPHDLPGHDLSRVVPIDARSISAAVPA